MPISRRFELFACVTKVDDAGNVLEFSHGQVAMESVPSTNTKLDFQLSFDDWLERETFWAFHMENAESFETEFDDAEGE